MKRLKQLFKNNSFRLCQLIAINSWDCMFLCYVLQLGQEIKRQDAEQYWFF